MCGRTACTLAPDDICRACRHTAPSGSKAQPKWKDPPGGQKYYPSFNAAPGSHLPVLLSKKHVDPKPKEAKKEEETEGETTEDESPYMVQPMHWGLVPFWHKGEPKSIGYNLTNARSDTMMEKRSYKVPLEKGRRCVVLADGYFEWQTKDDKKQPYFIYFPQSTATDAEDVKAIKDETEKPDAALGEKKLITMAGLFDVWKQKDSEAPLYSYSIITVDAHKSISWLHHRMPAILNGEEEITQWLDSGDVPISKALKLIRPVDSVKYHPVSTFVNKSTNNSTECIKEIDLNKRKETASSKLMSAWLQKGKKRSPPPTEVKAKGQELPTKQAKLD